MDKAIFDLLGELLVMMDTRIVEQKQIRSGAHYTNRTDLTNFSEGKIAGYQMVAAWAREKMKPDKVTVEVVYHGMD